MAIGSDRRLVVVVRQLIAKIDKLSLQLPKCGQHLCIRIDNHMAFASIDYDRIARLCMSQNSIDAADRRDASTARDDCGVTGLTTSLSDDAVDWSIAQHNHLAWQ